MATDNELARMLGEISSDVKHVLTRQDKQDERIERMNVRLSKAEAFQWKLAGIAMTVPTVIATIGLTLRFLLPA
jgi:hypothetical protein